MNKEIIKKRFLKEFLSDPAIKFIVKNNLADIRDLVKEASTSDWRGYIELPNVGRFLGGALQSGTIEEQPPEDGKYFMTRGSSRAYLIFIKRAFSVLLRLMEKAEAAPADIDKVKDFLEKRESRGFKEGALFSASPPSSTTTESTDRSISDEDRRLFLQSRIEDLREQADILFLIQELLLLTFFLDGDKSQDNSVKEPLVVNNVDIEELKPVIDKLNDYTDEAFNLDLDEVPIFDNTDMKSMEDRFKPFKSTLYKIMYVTAQKLDKYRDDKHIKGEKSIDEIDRILDGQRDKFTDSAGSVISPKKLRKLAARLLYDKVDPKIFPVLGDIYEKWKKTPDDDIDLDKSILDFINEPVTEGIDDLSDEQREFLKNIKVNAVLKPSITKIFTNFAPVRPEKKSGDADDGEEDKTSDTATGTDDAEASADDTADGTTDSEDTTDTTTSTDDAETEKANFTEKVSKFFNLVERVKNNTVAYENYKDYAYALHNGLTRILMKENDGRFVANWDNIFYLNDGLRIKDFSPNYDKWKFSYETSGGLTGHVSYPEKKSFAYDRDQIIEFYETIASRLKYKSKTEPESTDPDGSKPKPEPPSPAKRSKRPPRKSTSKKNESKNIKIAKTIIKLVEKQYQRKKHG